MEQWLERDNYCSNGKGRGREAGWEQRRVVESALLGEPIGASKVTGRKRGRGGGREKRKDRLPPFLFTPTLPDLSSLPAESVCSAAADLAGVDGDASRCAHLRFVSLLLPRKGERGQEGERRPFTVINVDESNNEEQNLTSRVDVGSIFLKNRFLSLEVVMLHNCGITSASTVLLPSVIYADLRHNHITTIDDICDSLPKSPLLQHTKSFKFQTALHLQAGSWHTFSF